MFTKVYERLANKEPILIGTEQINIKPLIKSLPVILTAGMLGFYAGKITEAINIQGNPGSLVQNLSKEQLEALHARTIEALAAKNTESK